MKKFNMKSIIGMSAAVIAGVVAFIGARQDQKKDEQIEDMDKRIKLLESNSKAE